MAHINLGKWNGRGPRPCDWCGNPLDIKQEPGFLHPACAYQERKFYIELGESGESEIRPPSGYKITIPTVK